MKSLGDVEKKNVKTVNDLYGRQECSSLGRYSYLSHTNKCYKFFNGKASWTAARTSCAAKGGELASVPDKTTNDFLITLTTLPSWVGGYRLIEGQDIWGWTDGYAFDYSNWASRHQAKENGRQKYILLNIEGGLGKWDDGQDTEDVTRGYICQKPRS